MAGMERYRGSSTTRWTKRRSWCQPDSGSIVQACINSVLGKEEAYRNSSSIPILGRSPRDHLNTAPRRRHRIARAQAVDGGIRFYRTNSDRYNSGLYQTGSFIMTTMIEQDSHSNYREIRHRGIQRPWQVNSSRMHHWIASADDFKKRLEEAKRTSQSHSPLFCLPPGHRQEHLSRQR